MRAKRIFESAHSMMAAKATTKVSRHAKSQRRLRRRHSHSPHLRIPAQRLGQVLEQVATAAFGQLRLQFCCAFAAVDHSSVAIGFVIARRGKQQRRREWHATARPRVRQPVSWCSRDGCRFCRLLQDALTQEFWVDWWLVPLCRRNTTRHFSPGSAASNACLHSMQP